MKKVYLLFIASALISILSCGSDTASKVASGIGGPELSPEVITDGMTDTTPTDGEITGVVEPTEVVKTTGEISAAAVELEGIASNSADAAETAAVAAEKLAEEAANSQAGSASKAEVKTAAAAVRAAADEAAVAAAKAAEAAKIVADALKTGSADSPASAEVLAAVEAAKTAASAATDALEKAKTALAKAETAAGVAAAEAKEEIKKAEGAAAAAAAAEAAAAEAAAIEAANQKVELTLDTTAGRWMTAPKKELFTADEMKASREKIAAIQAQIKDLKEADKKDPQIAALRAEIQAIRAKYGVNRMQTGIYTAWANQSLYVNAKVKKSGWYNLRIVAINIYGNLPADYSHYNVTVYNETEGKDLGGVQIKASTTSNQAAGLLVYLPVGDTKLLLKWTNDAYKQGVYDANININTITMKYKGQEGPGLGALRRAHQYSYVDGNFFWDTKTVRTYWANQTIGFNYSNLEAGKYKVTVKAKNYGVVPKEYKNFKVRVNSGDGAEVTLEIKADEKNFHKGTAEIDITGPTSIYLTWLNDMYKPERTPVEDANIQYEWVKMTKIGDSERSAAAAYLLGTSSGNMVMTFGSIGILGLVLGVFFVINRRRVKKSA